MTEFIKINGVGDPGVERFFRISAARLHPSSFIAESPNVILRALENGFEPEALLCEENQTGEDAAAVLERLGDGVPVYAAPPELMSQITGYNLIRGMMCSFKRPVPVSTEDITASARRVAVLDGVVDAANVGAIFRSAAALGMDAVLLHESCDPLNRRSIRSSMGAVFQVPWAVLDGHSSMEALHRLGFKTVAMALRNDSICLEDKRLSAEPRLAVVLGNEGHGLPAAEIAAADYVVRIPMAHGVDSLSVTSAAAIAFWQLR